jgi:hypothetical protein
MRDIDKNPYSPDEARVAKFFFDLGVGGGDDPIGNLLASHAALAAINAELRKLIETRRAARKRISFRKEAKKFEGP